MPLRCCLQRKNQVFLTRFFQGVTRLPDFPLNIQYLFRGRKSCKIEGKIRHDHVFS